jgi:hypothetical protein
MTTAAGIRAMRVGMAMVGVVMPGFRVLGLVVDGMVVCSHVGFALKRIPLRNLKLL